MTGREGGRERGGRDRFAGVTGSGRVGKEEQKEGDIAVTGAAACLTQVGIAASPDLSAEGDHLERAGDRFWFPWRSLPLSLDNVENQLE